MWKPLKIYFNEDILEIRFDIFTVMKSEVMVTFWRTMLLHFHGEDGGSKVLQN
jgi:hypothetical protein